MANLGYGGMDVLDRQAAMNGGAQQRQDFLAEVSDVIDATPRFVAGMLVGAVLGLAALRLAGFRFSFGVGVGGGGS